MMAGNPNWWSMIDVMHSQQQQQQQSHNHHHQMLSSTNNNNNYLSPSSNSSSSSHSQYLYGSSSPPLSSSSTALDDHHPPTQDFPRSWSQLLMCGIPSDQERFVNSYNWFQNGEDHHHHQALNNESTNISSGAAAADDDVKQEINAQQVLYGHVINDQEYHHQLASSRLFSRPPHQAAVVNVVSSPTSCVTSLSSTINLLNFSTTSTKTEAIVRNNHQQCSDNSTEGNSSIVTGGIAKKPRLQQSSQPALKVRKEKLGDRITALHQLVSPFGKTDTASVLSEAIGYIRFLLGQIEALSSPYLDNVSRSMGHQQQQQQHQHSVQERSNCLFTEEPDQDGERHERELSSRGLCLVPISCTQNVGNENGADYWAPAFGGGF